MFVRNKNFAILFFCWFLCGTPNLHGQAPLKHPALYFISDCQDPLPIEKLIRKAHNNREGKEVLFREIETKNEGYVFMLGDLVGKGSENVEWGSVDTFLKTIREAGTKVYAVPGNHEYLMNDSRGIANFQKRFPEMPLNGYCVRTDSMATVMLNSNFDKLPAPKKEMQQKWYLAVMDSLDMDASVKIVIVCTHHSPFSNSKVVGSSTKVQEAFIPRFESSPKTKLFITGHSHNLECFDGNSGKRFLVIGGGGGLDQPLYTGVQEKQKDMISQADKPRFFYVVLQRSRNVVEVKIRGFSREMSPVSEIKLSL